MKLHQINGIILIIMWVALIIATIRLEKVATPGPLRDFLVEMIILVGGINIIFSCFRFFGKI